MFILGIFDDMDNVLEGVLFFDVNLIEKFEVLVDVVVRVMVL